MPGEMTSMAATLSSAMAFLESQGVIHRDLAARNVLVGRCSTDVKIADLGAARSVHRSNEGAYNGVYTATTDHTPARWMALEALREAKFSHKSDVFAFGVLLWEILSHGQTPWGVFNIRDMSEALARGDRLQFPQGLEQQHARSTDTRPASRTVARKIYAIAVRCWAEAPRARPPFLQIEGELATHNTVLRAEASAALNRSSAGKIGDSDHAAPRSSTEFANQYEYVPLGANIGAGGAATCPDLDENGYVEDSMLAMAPGAVLDEDGYVEDSATLRAPAAMLDEDGYVEDSATLRAPAAMLDEDGYVEDSSTIPASATVLNGDGYVEVVTEIRAIPQHLPLLGGLDHVQDDEKAAVFGTSPTAVANGTEPGQTNCAASLATAVRGRADSVYNGFDGSSADATSGAVRGRQQSLCLGFNRDIGVSGKSTGDEHPDETRL
jgi:hypothetical protein